MITNASALPPLDLESVVIRDPLIVTPETKVMAVINQMSNISSLLSSSKTADDPLNQACLGARFSSQSGSGA